jgi:hypothetical protein
MIDKIFKYYVVVLLLIIGGILIFVLVRISPKNKISKDDPNNNIESLYFQNNILTGLMNNGLTVNDDIVLFNSDGNIRDIKLSELPSTLVFRFSSFSCNMCIDYVLEKMKKHFEHYEINPNVLIIVSESNPSAMKKWKNILHLRDSNTLGLPVERAHIPFIFLLEKGKVTHLFIPDESFDKYMEFYFKLLKDRYFPRKP